LTEKKKLLEDLKRSGFVTRENVMRAFLRVPREEFVPQHLRNKAYVDHPLPIPGGQTISAPHGKAEVAFRAKHVCDDVRRAGIGRGNEGAGSGHGVGLPRSPVR